MSKSVHETRLLACITFHFNAARLQHLYTVVRTLADFAVVDCDVVVCTNSVHQGELETLRRACAKLFSRDGAFEIISFTELETPRTLPWSHKKILRERFCVPKTVYTHFLYLEDDIQFSLRNLKYFLDSREGLRDFGLIPGFVRVELNQNDLDYFLTDQHTRNNISSRRKVSVGTMNFVNIGNPYAAMYLFDHEMAAEHLSSRSSDMRLSKEVCCWGRPERATLGLTYENIPADFESRLVVPIDPDRQHPSAICWVHHLTANYTNDYRPGPQFHLGKIRVDDGFD